MANPKFDVTPFLDQDQVEGQHFDRKSMLEGPPGAKRARDRREMREQAAEYVAAFANADGGVLLLGVEDDGEVTGNGFPLRVGDQTVRARETQVAATKQQGMYESWESRRSSCSLEGLDPELLARERAGAGLSALCDEEYLLKRRLADQRGGTASRRGQSAACAR